MAHCSQLISVSNIAEYQKSRLVRRNSFTYQKGTVGHLYFLLQVIILLCTTCF